MKSNLVFQAVDKSNLKGVKYIPKLVKVKNKKRKQKKIKQKPKVIIPKKYKKYIKSGFWKQRKKHFYQRNKKQCQACDSIKNVDLHHLLYKEYGNEKDEHLVALCRDCHQEFHDIYGVKMDLIKDTNEFIIEKREMIEFPKFRGK